jgi:uncharacterized protein (TIGR00297 family)
MPLYAALRQRSAAAAVVTLIFALLAHRWRAVSFSGAAAGAVVAFVLYATSGPEAFLTLAAVFLITVASTRYGQTQKRQRGIAEPKTGRNGWQVLANLSAAAALSTLALSMRRPEMLLAAVAALAEAAADTASSEIGKAASDHVYLITNFQRTAVGTDGGISMAGTLCGIAAAAIVAQVAFWCRLIPRHHEIAIVAGAAVLGSFLDSLLGATLQRRGWLSNSAVNLVSTLAAAALALILSR